MSGPQQAQAADSRASSQARKRPLGSAQDGHSFFEEAVYQFLWRRSGTSSSQEPSRETTAGYRTIGAELRIDAKTVKRALHSLAKKLAIESIVRTPQGTKYRVYSFVSIKKRRKDAGFGHFIRNRGGVALCQ